MKRPDNPLQSLRERVYADVRRAAAEAEAVPVEDKLRFLLDASGMTLGELSRQLGMPYHRVEKILGRRATASDAEIRGIARVLDADEVVPVAAKAEADDED